MLTLEEFNELPEEERRERFKELSAADRSFVRIHQGSRAYVRVENPSPKKALEELKSIEQLFKEFDLDLAPMKEYWRERLEEEK